MHAASEGSVRPGAIAECPRMALIPGARHHRGAFSHRENDCADHTDAITPCSQLHVHF